MNGTKPRPQACKATDSELKLIRRALERGQLNFTRDCSEIVKGRDYSWATPEKIKELISGSIFLKTAEACGTRQARFSAINLGTNQGFAFVVEKAVRRMDFGVEVHKVESITLKVIGFFLPGDAELSLAREEKERQKAFTSMMRK